jgi:endoglucanase
MFPPLRRLAASLAVLAVAAVAAGSGRAETAAATQAAALGRGINILGSDPIWSDPAKARFQAAHFRATRAAGFSSVRIVLRAFAFMNPANALPPTWFATLDWAVDEARKAGLAVILDEHDDRFCGEDAAGCREKLLAFWRQVGAHERAAPDDVVFELLNEPNRAVDPVWNDLLAEALAVVRQTNPTRNVVVGPAQSNSRRGLERLRLPEDDRHLIVTVHYYEPMPFTHQGAGWTRTRYPVGTTWGSAADRAQIERDFDGVAAWARAQGRPIFLGEFGAYDKADMGSRAAYTAAVARAAEARGWSWAYRQFSEDLVASDIKAAAWGAPILGALVP